MPSPDDCTTLQALFETVDHARAEAELEWGAGRLPFLVSDDLRLKLRRQQARWSAAIQAAWQSERLTGPQLEDVRSAAGGMQRAWSALIAAASEAGHRPVHVDIWEIALEDGTVAALVRSNDEAAKVIADGRYLSVYTAAEVGHIIDALPVSLQLAKQVFPGATIQQPVDRTWVKHGDQIPFGEVA